MFIVELGSASTLSKVHCDSFMARHILQLSQMTCLLLKKFTPYGGSCRVSLSHRLY